MCAPVCTCFRHIRLCVCMCVCVFMDDFISGVCMYMQTPIPFSRVGSTGPERCRMCTTYMSVVSLWCQLVCVTYHIHVHEETNVYFTESFKISAHVAHKARTTCTYTCTYTYMYTSRTFPLVPFQAHTYCRIHMHIRILVYIQVP
jgi:hypothetical protein